MSRVVNTLARLSTDQRKLRAVLLVALLALLSIAGTGAAEAAYPCPGIEHDPDEVACIGGY